MQLNNLIIEPRVRSAWSAIDLGFTVAKLFWLRSVCLYLVVAIPVFLMTRLIADYGAYLTFFILWWCKPLFERPILFLLSRELFSNSTNFLNTLRHFRLWLYPGLGWILSIRRISLVRSMTAPITLLEQPDPSQYTMRASVLTNRSANEATWLTLMLYQIESISVVAVLALLVFLFPDHIEVSFAWFNYLEDNNIYLGLGIIITMALIAPFYAAGGFMLYISRRIELEGWDIEICFRDWMTEFNANPLSRIESGLSGD